MNKHGKIEKTKQLNLKDNETYELAAKVARYHDESLNDAVKTALRQRLERDLRSASKEERLKKALAILQPYWDLPITDTRSADEILGYDENGLPT